MTRLRAQDGFTLVETMVVVVVIGVLAAIAIPRLLAHRTAARNAAAVSDLRNLATVEVSLEAGPGLTEDADVLEDEGWDPSDGRVMVCADLSASGDDITLTAWHLDGTVTYSWKRSDGTVLATDAPVADTCPAGAQQVS